MSQRRAAFVFDPIPVDEAPGVTIRRTIGGDRLILLDPFLLLDHVTVDPERSGGEVGFPRHPHRGIETLSWVLQGEVAHRDSLGNEGRVGRGGSQWMTAGNGIWHEEHLAPDESGGEFLQLWFNLPASLKRIPAGYAGCAAVPVVSVPGGEVRIAAGSFAGVAGAFEGIAVRPVVLEVSLEPGASVELPAPFGDSAFAYVAAGSLLVEGSTAVAPQLMVFGSGEGVVARAGDSGARFLFASASPLAEPVMQYRSFVMNTADDIGETLEMVREDRLGV